MEQMTIRQARMMRDITIERMANKLNVCRDTYRKMEHHPEKISIEHAISISEFLNVPLDNLIFLPEGSTLSRYLRTPKS